MGADNAPGLYSINRSPRTCYLEHNAIFVLPGRLAAPMKLLHIKVGDENPDEHAHQESQNLHLAKNSLSGSLAAVFSVAGGPASRLRRIAATICAQLCRGMLSACQRARYRLWRQSRSSSHGAHPFTDERQRQQPAPRPDSRHRRPVPQQTKITPPRPLGQAANQETMSSAD